MKARLNKLFGQVSVKRLTRRLTRHSVSAPHVTIRGAKPPEGHLGGSPKSVTNRGAPLIGTRVNGTSQSLAARGAKVSEGRLDGKSKSVTATGATLPQSRLCGASSRADFRGATLTGARTGWTVHRDVALRLKNISVAEPDASPDDPGREVGAFKIRIAGSPLVRNEAGCLVQQRYARKGYGTSATKVSPNVCTFAAYDEGRLAGTVSLRHDSGDGLAADEIYRQELDLLRDAGRTLCEFTRLAVDVSRVSRPVLAGLFHTVFLYATKLHNFDFVVIEVTPRHSEYYRKSLGFKAIGPERHNARVNTTGVLMGMSFAEVADHLHCHAGMAARARKTRSLYAYGFSKIEEAGILGRLRSLHTN